jgi:hypothetical protein
MAGGLHSMQSAVVIWVIDLTIGLGAASILMAIVGHIIALTVDIKLASH